MFFSFLRLVRIRMPTTFLPNSIYVEFISICIKGNRAAMKGLGIGTAMPFFSQMSACFAIVNYAVLVFKKAGTSLDPYASSIVLAVAVLIGSLTTTYLADKLGRKLLNFISMTGSAVGLLTLSLYHYLHLSGYDVSAFSAVPVICLSFVAFISSAGIIPLTVVVCVENMPPKVIEISDITKIQTL